MDFVELKAFIGLLILAGVYKSHNEATQNLWNEQMGRQIFRATVFE